MLFNPCQPCCAFNIIGGVASTLYGLFGLPSFFTAAGFSWRYYTSPLAADFNTHLTFIDSWALFGTTSAGRSAVRDWFRAGGKRLVIVSFGSERATWTPMNDAVNAFLASIASGIAVAPGSYLQPGAACGVAAFNPHYLTNGLTSYQHGNYYLNCVCHLADWMERLGALNHTSAGSGVLLTDYFGGHSMAVEKVNTPGGVSEVVSIGDTVGVGVYPPFSSSGGNVCWDQVSPPLPDCGGSFYFGGCSFNTPQFLLNLASMGIQ